MDKAYVATALAMKELNCEKIDTINDRILLQKKIYIAQIFGLPLGYGYSWYIHGPYSPDLTTAAYQIVPEGFDSLARWYFNDPFDRVIKRVNDLEEKRVASFDVVQWYELLSSVIFWRENGFIDKEKDIEKVAKSKPQFSKEEISQAYEVLVADGYIN